MPEVNEEIQKGRFDFNVTITKAWIQKGKEGEPDKYFLKAIASDTGVDHHGERFTEKALNQMINCIKNNDPAPVVLLPTHWDTFEIGKVVGGTMIDSPTHKDLKALEVDIELDMEYPQSKNLYKEVESGKAQKQLSVGGHLDMTDDKPYFWEEKEYEMPDGNVMYDYILVLNSLVLDHIAVTRKDHAANGRTGFTEAIAKSLGIEKPVRKETKKEVEPMSQAEKQAEGLIQAISKGIRDFFKSNDETEVKAAAARDAIAKAKQAMVEAGFDDAAIAKELGVEAAASAAPEATPETPAAPEAEAAKSTEAAPAEAAPAVDVEALKSQIITDVSKSLTDAQMETFKEISKSLGAVLGEAIQKSVAPVLARVEALEKSAAPSKALPGQEVDKEAAKGKDDQEGAEGDVWKGLFMSAIPSHVVAEKQHNKE